MAHYIQALTPRGDQIDYINVTGDLSAFYGYFDAAEMDQGTNGDGSFTVSLDGIQEYLKSPKKYIHELSGESLLREFLANVVNLSSETQIILSCA